jgi:hypothetical protein
MPNGTSPQAKAIKSKDNADCHAPGTVSKEGQVDVCAVFAPEAEPLCNEIFPLHFRGVARSPTGRKSPFLLRCTTAVPTVQRMHKTRFDASIRLGE